MIIPQINIGFKHHVYPVKGNEYFQVYRNFFISKLKENKIEIIYTVKPLAGDSDVLETILSKNCVKKTQMTDILDSYLLLECEDLKKLDSCQFFEYIKNNFF